MDTGGISATNFGTTFWLSGTRTLTSLGTGPLILQSVANTSIAANTAVDFRPAVGRFRLAYVGVGAGAAGTTVLEAGDGANFRITTSVASGQQGGEVSFGTSVSGLRILNQDATNAASYIAAAADFAQ